MEDILDFHRYGKSKDKLPNPWVESAQVSVQRSTGVDSHQELTILVGPHIVRKAGEVCKEFRCPGLLAFQPIFPQPTIRDGKSYSDLVQL